jgi:hypothetical protein
MGVVVWLLWWIKLGSEQLKLSFEVGGPCAKKGASVSQIIPDHTRSQPSSKVAGCYNNWCCSLPAKLEKLSSSSIRRIWALNASRNRCSGCNTRCLH